MTDHVGVPPMQVALYHVKRAGSANGNGAPGLMLELAGTRVDVELDAPEEDPLAVRFADEYQLVVPPGPPATMVGLIGPIGIVATWETTEPAPPGASVTVAKWLRIPMPRVIE